jgi:hypothetical protein
MYGYKKNFFSEFQGHILKVITFSGKTESTQVIY